MSPPKHAEAKDPLFVTTDEMEVGPPNGGAVDDVTQGTLVTQESEKTDGDSKKRRREDGAGAVNTEKEEEEEMKRNLAFFKKSYENAKALLEEKIKELDEVNDTIESTATDMEQLIAENASLEEAKKMADLKVAEVEKEKEALTTDVSSLRDLVTADPKALQRKENLERLQRIKDRKLGDVVATEKESSPSCSAPKCADKEPHNDIPLNIKVCGKQMKTEVAKAPGDDKPRETLGAPAALPNVGGDSLATRTELKKIELCTRDPCPFGEETCAFLHPTKGNLNSNLQLNKENLYRASLEGLAKQRGTRDQEARVCNRQERKLPRQGQSRPERERSRISTGSGFQRCTGPHHGQCVPSCHGELQGNTLAELNSSPLVKNVVNKHPDSYDLSLNSLNSDKNSDKNSNILPEFPSLIIHNTREVGYRNKTLFVLNDKRYEKADWETIDSIFEQTTHGNYVETKIESNKDLESSKDQTCTEQKSSHCPYGNNCLLVHNPCQVFKPSQSKKLNLKTEKLGIYSCNVRSINNKKNSVAEILKSNDNDIDICILSELSTQNMPKFKGYTNFECLKKRRNHGICIMVKNHLREGVIRIAEEELEIVHIRLENTTPALNVVGVYLDVEANSTVEDTKSAWFKYKNRVDFILNKGEALVTLGDFNRPIDNPKVTCGKQLLFDWIKEDTMTLLNDDKRTRVDPGSKKESILDLALVSKNIESYVKSFYVDMDKNMTPCNKMGNFSDHRAIKVVLEVPVLPVKNKNKKEERINFRNAEGWNTYAEVSDKYAEEIINVINSNEDLDLIERRIKAIDGKIQKESFGTVWIGPSKKKKVKKRNTAQVKKEVTQSFEELDNMIDKGLLKKDLNQQMYKLKEAVVGPKIKPQEPMAINHPISKELITNKTEIKKAYLDHNVGILTKKPIAKQFENDVKIKEDCHEKVMTKPMENTWVLEQQLFKKVVDKIKKKGKQVYRLFVKAGTKYKDAVFKYMSKLIETEQIPLCFKNTILTPIWKKKGSALDLNNMRFIHMRHWRSKLLESLVTESMKDKIVNATPKFQLGGMPKCRSVENLVVLKTWMKMKEEQHQSGIFQCFDMEKFFDKERLLDCMYTLHNKAKIDDKSYRLWFKLNEDTRISVNTSVGKSGSKVIKDSVGQGSSGAALVSALNIGCAVEDAFKNQTSTTIGEVELNSEVFQDDIANLNDNTSKQRQACENIHTELSKKGLSINYNKSKFVVIGNKKQRNEILKEASENPIKMGDSYISNSEQEQYLGDMINQEGCAASITATIKERIRKLTSKCHDIIQISESPIMGGLGNSTAPFKLYDATIAEGLLTNCESWIGINQNQIDMLQSFQDKFIKNALRLADSIPKALLTWDIGLTPVKWRIALKKLLFLHRIMLKDIRNITKQVLYEEVIQGIKGLAYECSLLCKEIGLRDIMFFDTTEGAIKNAVWQKMNEEALVEMQSKKKVSDRLSDNPEDNSYILQLSLPESRVWIRYRGRAISGVKCNFKNSHKNDLECRFCPRNTDKLDLNGSQDFSDESQKYPDELEEYFSVFQGTTDIKYPDETQEHLEVCDGTAYERRGIQDMSNWRNVLKFWRRMSIRLARMSSKNTRTSKVKN